MAAPTYQTTANLQVFLWLAVNTGADTVVSLPDSDIAIKHTGWQANDTTNPALSLASDFIVVTDVLDAAPTQDLAPGDATGSTAKKLIMFAGDADGFRGYDIANDKTLGGAGTSRKKIKIRAFGNTAFVKLVIGNTFGCEP